MSMLYVAFYFPLIILVMAQVIISGIGQSGTRSSDEA